MPDGWRDLGAGNVDQAIVGAQSSSLCRRFIHERHGRAFDRRADEAERQGLRAHYHPNYYGAFVLDPDGHNVEAVCHTPA
jgi:hypothetical protein